MFHMLDTIIPNRGTRTKCFVHSIISSVLEPHFVPCARLAILVTQHQNLLSFSFFTENSLPLFLFSVFYWTSNLPKYLLCSKIRDTSCFLYSIPKFNIHFYFYTNNNMLLLIFYYHVIANSLLYLLVLYINSLTHVIVLYFR